MVESIKTHNGTITIANPNTGEHRTFKVHTQPEDSKFAPGRRVVSLLTGPNNVEDFTPFGFVLTDGSIQLWQRYNTKTYQAFASLLERPETSQQRWGMTYLWSARCRRCNRTLSTPESITSGLGETCRLRSKMLI
jgi:hypothetical protein